MSVDQLTASGNAAMVFPVVAIIAMAISRWRHVDLSIEARHLRMAIVLVCLAFGSRVLLWLAAIWTRVPPAPHGDWAYQVRDEVTIVCAVVLAIGLGYGTAAVTPWWTLRAWVALYLGLGVLSAGVGYVLTPV